MSLEVALAQNTAAIQSLVALLAQGVTLPIPSGAGIPQAQAPVADNSASSTAEIASEKVRSDAAAKKSAKGSDKVEAEQPATEAEGVTYEQAAAAIQNVAKTKGRDSAIAILKKFGAAKLPDVDAKNFAAIVAACEAA